MDTFLLEIRLFGSFDVQVEGKPLPQFRSRTEKWLLMLLALRAGQPLSREWLATTLWPDSQNALFNLRRSLTHLRQALGPAAHLLHSPTPQTLCLERADALVDVIAFDAAVAEDSSDRLEEAVSLYRGPLLEDCSEEWALTARLQREQAYLATLETLAERAAARNHPTTTVRYLRLTIATDPLHEAAYVALMQALATCGDYAAVTQVYRDLRLLLHRELQVSPSPETEALYRHLQEQAKRAHFVPPAADAAPPRRLPVPFSSLIGREEEISEVAQRMRQERLVTLMGTGGVGKTRLAIAVAEALAPTFTDGVWFVALAALTDPNRVTPAVASTLGIKEQPGHTLEETLIEALSSRSLLLILDNCEHLLEACADLTEALLQGCPHLRILATSRQALGLTGEAEWQVPSLSFPLLSALNSSHQEVDKGWMALLSEYEAIRLFVVRAQQTLPTFQMTPQNAEVIAQICARLDGIPLAIELAAARIKVLSADQIQARLKDRFALLTGGNRTALPRQQTLRATLDWSYNLLTASEQRLLQRLSVFADGWTLDAAEQVCSAARSEKSEERSEKNASFHSSLFTIHTSDVLDLLTGLVDRSLTLAEEGQEGVRFWMLETVREYAREKLIESREEGEMRRRHRDFFLDLASEARKNIYSQGMGYWLEILDREHDNLRAALAYCLEEAEGAEKGLCLGVALRQFWYARGYLTEGREFLTALLSLPQAQKRTRVRAEALVALGVLGNNQSGPNSTRSLFEESLAIMKELEDRPGIAISLNYLGIAAQDQGDYASARTLYEQSLAIRRELGDKQGVAITLNNLGKLVSDQGDNTTARNLFAESLAILKELGHRQGTATLLINLGSLASGQGDYASARALFEEALAIQREFGHRLGIARTLNSLGGICNIQGDRIHARSLFEESLTICRELGAQEDIAASLNNLGFMASDQSDYASAQALFEEALAIYRELGEKLEIATCFSGLGNNAFYQGDYASARTLYEQSLAIQRELGNKDGVAQSLNDLGTVALEQGDYASARTLLEQSLTLMRELGDKRGIVQFLDAWAVLAAKEQDLRQSAQLSGAADALRVSMGIPMLPKEREEYDKIMEQVRSALDEEAFVSAWKEGSNLGWEQAVALALAETE